MQVAREGNHRKDPGDPGGFLLGFRVGTKNTCVLHEGFDVPC